MIIVALLIYGLCLGSFVNALVWRVHKQAEEEDKKKPNKKLLKDLSVSRGRSMCPSCRHTLAAKDLIPVLSWLSLKGKCRYCSKRVSVQYPLVELATAGLFVVSYLAWPEPFTAPQIAIFVLWLVILVGLMALTVYDARWMLLPNRIIYPLWGVAAVQAAIRVASSSTPLTTAASIATGTAVGGGVFLLLFHASKGKWIGYGDVRLGWLFGAVVGSAGRSLTVIFLASLLGCLFALPALINRKLQGSSEIPFGPFLIAGTIIVYLFGTNILDWYLRIFNLG